ncbi:MAG TPA: YtxH domain-containing protein [Cyclobacteriaceae bacterium]|nr:YtxH domain-containing protein [Cyclobacteriaceae bacterium]
MKKIVLGLGIVSGAVLAAYLFSGDRGQRTRNYIVRRVRAQKESVETDANSTADDTEIHYV